MQKQPIPSESAEQIAFVNWFREEYPGAWIFAIPNGGFRHKATATRMRLEGLSPGVPDLYIPAWKLWIEFKRSDGGNGLSGDQEEWRDYLLWIGDAWMQADGAADAVNKIKEFVDKYDLVG